MSKKIAGSVISLVAAFILSAGLMAQEKTEVSIQVKKDGKVVKDTTYMFEDASEAKHVLKMVEVMTGTDADMETVHYNYTMAHPGGKHANTMVFISEDGEKTKIKEMHGDSLVWISEGDDPHVKHMHGEKVAVMKKGSWTVVSSDEANLDENENVYFISEDDDVKVIVIKKEIHEDGDHDSDEDHDEDHDVDVDVKVVKKKLKVEKK